MRVLVCGGRDITDYWIVRDVLNRQHTLGAFDSLVHGGYRGADMLADRWAKEHGVQPIRCDALWDYYAKLGRRGAAGPQRNEFMLTLNPQLVIAFPGGAGTADMVARAKGGARCIPVIEIPS